ncbi:MAG: hypothetical protein HPY50_10625 [Firmicutes bacterium]|nr:hypothetical protein [Bacillota bacterium]
MILSAVKMALNTYCKGFPKFLILVLALMVPNLFLIAAVSIPVVFLLFGGADNFTQAAAFFSDASNYLKTGTADLPFMPSENYYTLLAVLFLFVLAVQVVVLLLKNIGTTIISDDLNNNRERAVLDTLRLSGSKLLRVFLLSVIYFLIFAVLGVAMLISYDIATSVFPGLIFVLFFILVPVVFYLLVKLSLAFPICVMEGLPVFDCITQSFKRASDFWWLLLCFVLTGIGIAALNYIISSITPSAADASLAVYIPLAVISSIAKSVVDLFLYVLLYFLYQTYRPNPSAEEHPAESKTEHSLL